MCLSVDCSNSINYTCENSCPTAKCDNELYENCDLFISDVMENVTFGPPVNLNCAESVQLCDKECGKKYFYLMQCYNNDVLQQECDGNFITEKCKLKPIIITI